MAMPSEKALGPDGFFGLFYKLGWPTIKGDLLNAIAKFHSGNAQNFHKLNSANLTLLPKKDEPEAIKDFRPISLIHSFSKIITKLLSLRLSPVIGKLVSPVQSAFISSVVSTRISS